MLTLEELFDVSRFDHGHDAGEEQHPFQGGVGQASYAEAEAVPVGR